MKKALFAVLIALVFGGAGWLAGSKYPARLIKQWGAKPVPGPVLAHVDFDAFNKLVANDAATGTLQILPKKGAFFDGHIRLAARTAPLQGTVQVDGFEDKVAARDLVLYKAHHVQTGITLAVQSGAAAPAAAPQKSVGLSDYLNYLVDAAILAFVLFQLKTYRGRARVVERPTATFEDVAGLTGPKQEVREIVEYLKAPQRLDEAGARAPKGILLYGPPGNGKTLLAKAVAGEAGITFIEQNASSFIQLFVGAGAMAVRGLFRQARKHAPCIIFIDEIDAVGATRFGAAGSHEERLQTLNALLAEMDGMHENEGIVVMAATNQPDVLDPALLRPGRFDRKVMIPMPGGADRRQILSQYLGNLQTARNVDLEALVRQSSSFSGADIANWCNEAAIEASRDGVAVVSAEHFKASRDRILIGPRNHGISLSEKERSVTAWHEAGHAIVRLATGGKLDKVSILPRGQAMGVTVSVPEDTIFGTRDSLDRELQVLMGGRAAEELYCGQISTGAANDMARASELARTGVLQHGFGDFGPYVPKSEKLIAEGERMSAVWLKAAYAKAKETLQARRGDVERLRDRLLAEDEVAYDG